MSAGNQWQGRAQRRLGEHPDAGQQLRPVAFGEFRSHAVDRGDVGQPRPHSSQAREMPTGDKNR
jgi:hypothetical protein